MQSECWPKGSGRKEERYLRNLLLLPLNILFNTNCDLCAIRGIKIRLVFVIPQFRATEFQPDHHKINLCP